MKGYRGRPRRTRLEAIRDARTRQAADAAHWQADAERRAALRAFQFLFLIPPST